MSYSYVLYIYLYVCLRVCVCVCTYNCLYYVECGSIKQISRSYQWARLTYGEL